MLLKSVSIISAKLLRWGNMIKRTLYFGNPAYLSLRNNQLVIKRADDGDLPFPDQRDNERTIPIEDIGVVIMDNKQLTITSGVMEQLLENNVAVITCDSHSMPTGLFLPLYGNTLQSERFADQLNASVPLKKQLWQQTVESKINNQAAMLYYSRGKEARNMLIWANDVRSGDVGNMEARAAAYYWKNVFPQLPGFNRSRDGAAPNNLLNYGYAILRGIIARSLVGSGLLPTLGIHHHNRYNAYCLADDIMEPYRPYVDKMVFDFCEKQENWSPSLTKEAKVHLMGLPVQDVVIDDKRSPLLIAATTTTSSLNKCFSGVSRKILFPEFHG